MSINLNVIDILGKTAFHLACGEGHSNVVKIFMEISATLSIDLNAKDIIGQTTFHSACASGRFNVAKTFIENSVNLSFDFNAYNDNVGQTTIDLACSFWKYQCCQDVHGAGNASARVQRVHAPTDLWDINFCTP